ncbi:metallophosphoesterase [Orrella sp. JC864]|uniref:metallophosphoesterase n=1 Tax=Orrella sp. JC864 TaxID=3120298 RepID=UPI003FA6EC5E
MGAWLAPGLGATGLLAGWGSSDDDEAAAPPQPEQPQPEPGQPGQDEGLVSSFGLAVLPDTQFYARYAFAEAGNQFDRLYGSEPFLAQTQWLAAQAPALKIPFVIHVGDVVDQAGRPQQWEVADEAMKVLEDAGLPYSILAGNHDVLAPVGYDSDPVNGTDADRDGVSPLQTPYGLMLWDRLIRDNHQIFMTLNGHFHGSARLTKLNDFGHAVEQMVVDYQMAYQGGNGLMRFYEFDLSNNRIRALSFSPWVPQKPAETLNEFDQAMLTSPNDQFEIEMDFASRFAGFNPGFAAAAPSNAPLAAAAAALILDGFTDAQPPVRTPASGPQDYPQVAETRAHWRFAGGADGSPVAAGAVIADLSGNGNDLVRAPLSEPAGNTAQVEDLAWTADKHYNDPATRETTLYVEGAPVLRNIGGAVGLASLGLPWYVGAGFWDGGPPNNGFLDTLGEIRIVARPLPPAQWLTARAV